jgi:hypothetical protein
MIEALANGRETHTDTLEARVRQMVYIEMLGACIAAPTVKKT